MRSYAAARSFFSFCAFLAWSAIILGIIFAVIAVGTVSQFAGNNPMALLGAATFGLVIAAVGMFFLIHVQIGRAGVDSAEYAQQSLQVARDQLAFAKQVHVETKQTETLAKVAPANKKPAVPSNNTEYGFQENTLTHNGRTVIRLENGYKVGDMRFGDLDDAKAYIDTNMAQPAARDLV